MACAPAHVARSLGIKDGAVILGLGGVADLEASHSEDLGPWRRATASTGLEVGVSGRCSGHGGAESDGKDEQRSVGKKSLLGLAQRVHTECDAELYNVTPAASDKLRVFAAETGGPEATVSAPRDPQVASTSAGERLMVPCVPKPNM